MNTCNSVDDICIYACVGTNPCAGTLVQPPGLHSAFGLHSASGLHLAFGLYFSFQTSTLQVYALRLVESPPPTTSSKRGLSVKEASLPASAKNSGRLRTRTRFPYFWSATFLLRRAAIHLIPEEFTRYDDGCELDILYH